MVAVIDSLFPHAQKNSKGGTFHQSDNTKLRGVMNLVNAIPSPLQTFAPNDFSDFILASSAIEEALSTWLSRGEVSVRTHVKDEKDAITILRRVLATLPDTWPPHPQAQLTFIPDTALRTSISGDVGAASRALDASEWKTANVMAGAALEALLHWKLSTISQSAREASPAAPIYKGAKKALEDFVLHDCIVLAEGLSIITADDAKASMLTKDYRNLIHPGRAARIGTTCSRSTAHVAVGALFGVIERLTP